jgi:pimeloyl-ACP methyl ester carboxylesterase/uncharacterized protein YndB with AHSA1/START domain
MNGCDIIDEAFIDASPDIVWQELVAELRGAARWWVPHNTFEPGSVPPDQVGGETQVTVHTKGADQGGLKLRFTARTRSVKPGHRLVADYVAGVFRGSSEFTLDPVDNGQRTRLSMHFRGQPHGRMRLLARIADIGLQHSKGTQSAFANLNALVDRERTADPERAMSQSVVSSLAGTTEHILRTDDGARLAITILAPTSGSVGSTVVLSHGWAESRKVWRAVADRLLDVGHSVVLYDQRGHGRSTLGNDPIGITRLGKDLETVLAHIDATDAVVAAHSGGGFAAMAYATANPRGAAARLRGLALLATAAHDQDTSAGEVHMMGSGLFTWALSRPRLGRRMLGQTMGPRPDLATLEMNRQMFATTPARVRADCFRSSRGMDLRPGLASVTVPTVVLAGEADRIIAPKLGKAIAEAMPNARFEQLPDAGHMLHLEAPDRVARVIAELATR